MNPIFLPRESIHCGSLILVNETYPYHNRENQGLLSVWEDRANVLLDFQAARLLSCLLDQISGWEKIVPVSGWRSMAEQQKIWDDSLAENGTEFTKTYVAAPGHSEHQTGLAIDLGLRQDSIDFIRPAFPYDGICQIFRNTAARYGFVERYPAGKEPITKIGHEPWHFRYVGVPHAAIMAENGMTLEEYIDFIKQYPGDRPYCWQENDRMVCISYWKTNLDGNTRVDLTGEHPYSISGNNTDGFILTEWRERYGAKAELRRA